MIRETTYIPKIESKKAAKARLYLSHAITIVLLTLWIPISIYQLLHFDTFKIGILRQPVSDVLAWSLIYMLPVLEITTACLLISERFRKTGLLLSSILMIIFTSYIGLALLGAWDTLPCECGLAIPRMSWVQHLGFNLIFLGISIAGLLTYKQKHKYVDNGLVPSAISHKLS